MAGIFTAVAAFVLVAFLASFLRFWPEWSEELADFVRMPQFPNATWDAMGLRYLEGGGDGCTYPREIPSLSRRNFHHLTFYGFLLCFAATLAGTIYHYVFGWKAPYPLYSLPVLLGIVGGAVEGAKDEPREMADRRVVGFEQLAPRLLAARDAALDQVSFVHGVRSVTRGERIILRRSA